MSYLVRSRDWYLGWMSIYGAEESAESGDGSREKLERRSEIAFALVKTIAQRQFRNETFETLAQVLDHEGFHLSVQKRRNPDASPPRGLEIEATSNIVKELSDRLFSAINRETPYQRELQLRALLSGLVLQQAQVAEAVQAEHHDQRRNQLKKVHSDVQNQRPPSGEFTSALFREYQSSFLVVVISEYANKHFIRAEPPAATLFRTVINATAAGVFLAVASTTGVGSAGVPDAIRGLDESLQQLGARPDKHAKVLFALQGLTRRTIALGLHTKVIEGREWAVDSKLPQLVSLWILEDILMVLNETDIEKDVSSPAYLVKDFYAAAGRNAPTFNEYHFIYGLLDCSTQLARMLLPGMVPELYVEQLDRFQQRMARIIENSKDRSLRWKAVEFLLLTCPQLGIKYPWLDIDSEAAVIGSCFAEEPYLNWQQELVDSVIGDLGNGSRNTWSPRGSVSTIILLNPRDWKENLPAPSRTRPAQQEGRTWPTRLWNRSRKYYSVGLSPSCRHVFFLGEEDLVIYSLGQISAPKEPIFEKKPELKEKLNNAKAALTDIFLAVIVRGVKVNIEGETSGSDTGSSQQYTEKATPSKGHQLWIFRHQGSSKCTFEDIKDFRPECLALHESSVLIGGYSDGVGVIQMYQIKENNGELRLYRQGESTSTRWTTRYFAGDGPKFVDFDASGQQMICVTEKKNNILIWPVEGNLKQEPFRLRERQYRGGFSARGIESVSLFRVPSGRTYAFCTNSPTAIHGREATGGEWPFISPVGTFPAQVPDGLEHHFFILGQSTAMVAGAVSAEGNLAAMLAQSGELIITPLTGDRDGGVRPSSSYSYPRLLCEQQNPKGSTASLRFVTQNDQTLLLVADISGKLVKFALGPPKEEPQSPLLQPGKFKDSPAPTTYEGYSSEVTSSQSSGFRVADSVAGQEDVLALSAVPAGYFTSTTTSTANQGQGQSFDTTGQIAPPGVKPNVTATLWEDEGSLCFQVEAKGVCVARREDNHMINGTKLLKVAGMTSWHSDTMLKSEQMKHIVKIGSTHLKGVWIPFERALDFANKEKITELLYPLFVHNIGALLYHPTNQRRTNVVIPVAERRKQEQNQMRNTQPPPGLGSLHQHHHHSMNNSISSHLPGPQHSLAPHPSVGRPSIDQAHTILTPPTSEFSLMGNMGSSDRNFQWGPQGGMRVQGPNPLAIDTGLSNARSRPTTPATTPPGTQIQSMQQYQQGLLPYDASLQSYSISRALYEECDPFQKMHGMDDIRQIVLSHLLANRSPSDPADPSAGKPRHIRPGLDYAQLESPWDTEQPLDASVFKAKSKAKFHVPLEAEVFLKEQFRKSDGCSLGSVITLTGTARYAQASTVRDYLGRNWPTTGPRLLKLIEELIAAGWDTSKRFSQDYERDARLSLRYFRDQRLFIHVEDTQQAVVEVAQQLAWLGCVLRTSQTGQIGRSQARMCPREGATEAEFELKFEVDALPVGEDSCWHDLFVNPVIAYRFPISSRGGELGLEISIPMMAALGGASRAVEFEGGLLLKGFSSAFVPLRRSGDSIQWHFIRNEDESRLSYREAGKRCPNRASLDTVDQDSLSSTRAFLGWWGKTTTHLGTADANYDNLDWSPAEEPHRSANFSGGSIGFQNFAAGELNFTVGPKDSKLHISRTGSYEKIIEYASITPAVLYDPVEGRAWLVPSSAVIAHIAQKKHFRKPFCVAGKRADIIPVDPNLNVFEAAEYMLLANGRTKLRHSDFGASEFCFKNLVLDIWSLLECLLDKDIKRETSADPKVHMPMSKSLRGWEFMDLVVERSPIRQKETGIKKTGGDWMDLAADINAVILFASGFEDVIRPAESSINGICHAWKQVPKGKDYLVAGVPILNSLYEQAGSRLTKEHLTSTHLQWSRGPMLFENCRNTGQFQCSCDRLQILVHKSRMTTVNPPGPLEEQGAVIFGLAKHPFNHSILTQRESRERSLYSQENTPLLLQIDRQESLHCISSTDYGSPSLPSLGSGTTINTSIESESEDTYGNVYSTPETERDNIRTLKRNREQPEQTFRDDRSARRPCSVQHPEQRYIQQYPGKRSTEATIAALSPNDLIAPTHYTLRSGDTIQPHALNRNPKLRFDENVSIGAARERFEGGQELASVHSHILQKTS